MGVRRRASFYFRACAGGNSLYLRACAGEGVGGPFLNSRFEGAVLEYTRAPAEVAMGDFLSVKEQPEVAAA